MKTCCLQNGIFEVAREEAHEEAKAKGEVRIEKLFTLLESGMSLEDAKSQFRRL